MPRARLDVTFVIWLLAMYGAPENPAWIPMAATSIAFRKTWGLDCPMAMPTCVPRILLSATLAADRTSPMPTEAVVITLLEKFGELSKACRGRSNPSNVLHETEPVAEALNWTPMGGKRETVLFATHVIGFATVPSAMSRPSTNKLRMGSTRTVVPGRIVSVTPGTTITCRVSTYTVSDEPQVVSAMMGPRTYVVAATCGAAVRSPPKATTRTARTVTTLETRGRWRGASMGDRLCGPDLGLARAPRRSLPSI